MFPHAFSPFSLSLSPPSHLTNFVFGFYYSETTGVIYERKKKKKKKKRKRKK